MKHVVKEIATIIKRDGMNGAYFPAYGKDVQFFIGGHNGVASAESLPVEIKNIQPLTVRKHLQNTLSKGIIFTSSSSGHKVVWELPLSALYNKKWSESKKVGEVKTQGEILFIDRIQEGKTVLTVKGDIFSLNLMTGDIKKVVLTTSVIDPSAVLRLSAGVVAFIAKKGSEIIAYPQNAPESKAIARAC